MNEKNRITIYCKVFFSRFENNIKKTLKLMPKLIFSKYENFKG